MVFSSAISLFFFVPIVFLLDRRLSNVDAKNTWLLLASLVFYSFGQVYYLPLLLASVALNYVCGRLAAGKYAKLGVTLAVLGGIGLLAVFKYADFAIRTLNALCGLSLPLTGIALPIGISFYTFQLISYTVDVYTEKVAYPPAYWKLLLYVSMFPQLIAGPIVRYVDVAAQIDARELDSENIFRGVTRFCIGLGKKVLLANQMGAVWSEIYALGGDVSALMAWTGAIAYTFQIYFDFSGYSDMAIGLGRMFGFKFPENFRYPYQSVSITDFWRRWHITLSTWFKEYLYIPLGGNRCGLARQALNLLIVWSLTGFWHGAGWNFVMWGLYYFVILFIEKLFLLKALDKLPKLFRHVYALLLIVIGWVIFASDDVSVLLPYLGSMFGANGAVGGMDVYTLFTKAVLLIICCVASTELPKRLFLSATGAMNEKAAFTIKSVMTIALLALSMILLIGDSYNPFLYFRF